MSRRVCLWVLLTLILCSFAAAAASEPAATVAPQPAATLPLAATAAQPAVPAAAALPAAPAKPESLPWLASAPNQSLREIPNLIPSFMFRNCLTDCGVMNRQCRAACNGNSICLQDCFDAFGCCHNACSGEGCP